MENRSDKDKHLAFEKWKRARPVLSALHLKASPDWPTKLRYTVWPDYKFFPLWAYQHHKAIVKFVKDTNGDPFDEESINDTANYLWHKDPKTVEENLN